MVENNISVNRQIVQDFNFIDSLMGTIQKDETRSNKKYVDMVNKFDTFTRIYNNTDKPEYYNQNMTGFMKSIYDFQLN